MCNHSYLINKEGNKFKNCPYPTLYKKWKKEENLELNLEHSIHLPHDDYDKCIFHSSQYKWKRENKFLGRFLDLISLIENDNNRKVFDFRDFVIVGDKEQENYNIPLLDYSFKLPIRLNGAKFKDSVLFKNIEFDKGGSMIGVEFQEAITFDECTFYGMEFDRSIFSDTVYFRNALFSSYAAFFNVHFMNGLHIRDCDFRDIANFEDCLFKVKNIYKRKIDFTRSIFQSTVAFNKSIFEAAVMFEAVDFQSRTDFIDSQFNLKETIDPSENSVTFKEFKLGENGVLNFSSTNPSNKLFSFDVGIRYKEEDVQGLIQFENANFQFISEESKTLLKESEKLGKVEIGKGCIKYRFQSKKKTLIISKENQHFITEITQVFANYFVNHYGLNLGVEIYERNENSITYFFFSDENIKAEVFEDRMQESEYDIWELLTINKDELDEINKELITQKNHKQLINVVDGITILKSILFRIKNRSDLGAWTEEDTKALVNAINFNPVSTLEGEKLHYFLENFSPTIIFDLSSNQTQHIKNQLNMPGVGATYIKKLKVGKYKGELKQKT